MQKNNLERINKRIYELINDGHELCLIAKPTNKPNIYSIQDVERLTKWKINIENLFLFLFVKNDFRYIEFLKLKETLHFPSSIKKLCSILDAVKDDINNGFLINYEFSLTSDMCNNFLVNAGKLNDEGYKAAAAIYVRIALETTLKKIAKKNGIEIYKKNINKFEDKSASELKNDLYKNKIIDKSQMNLIQSWLDIGNFAAHGKIEFDNYDKKSIQNLIENTKEFIFESLKT